MERKRLRADKHGLVPAVPKLLSRRSWPLPNPLQREGRPPLKQTTAEHEFQESPAVRGIYRREGQQSVEILFGKPLQFAGDEIPPSATPLFYNVACPWNIICFTLNDTLEWAFPT
jgi:hypothetical protein